MVSLHGKLTKFNQDGDLSANTNLNAPNVASLVARNTQLIREDENPRKEWNSMLRWFVDRGMLYPDGADEN